MFCVECGKEGELYGSLCAACFLARNRFTRIAEKVDLGQCAHCLEFLVKDRWREFDSVVEAAIQAALASIEPSDEACLGELGVEATPEDRSNVRVLIDAEVLVRGLVKREGLETTVRIKRTSCPRCNKIKGSYFESIIQVRARDRSMGMEEKLDLLREIEERVGAASKESRDQFISKVEEKHGGFDVYLSSLSLGKKLIRELAALHGAETKESSTLIGMREGKDLYRVTHLLRLPAYRRGDIIQFEDAPHLVEGVSSDRTRLIRLTDHLSLSPKNEELSSSKVIGHPSDIKEAVVVSGSDEELQLLHPVSYRTVEVRRPKGMTVGETVRVFLHEEGLLLLP